MSNIQNVSQQNPTIYVNGTQIKGELPSEQATLQLKSGDTIKGTVLSIVDTDGTKTVNISVGNNVISARLSEGMGLREGQTLNFAVRAFSSKNLTITPLFENTSIDQSTVKALDAAGIEVNRDTLQMVKEMMEASLPIDKESLQEMNKNLTSFPNSSISTMVEMKSLNIPITENNITQFESYKNYEHQVVNEMQNIIDDLPDTFNSMVENGQTSGALNLYGNILKLFSDGNMSTNANAEQVMAEADVPEGSQQVLDSATVPPTETSQKSGDAIVQQEAANLQKEIQPQFLDDLRNIGVSENALNKFTAAIKSGNSELAQKELLNEIAKTFDLADLSNSIESAAWKKLFASDDYNKLLRDNISSQWLLKPDEVQDKENIQNLYQRLENQIKHMTETINNTAGAESKLGQSANNLQNNLDFMNQLNQVFQFVQLPLQMTGQNVHGDLYVYRNKNKRISEDGSVSAVLHLDMEHLGPLDVYVKMVEKKVSTNFYVADDSILDLINDNIHILNERLEKRGYSMTVNMKLHDDKDGEDAAVDEMLDVTKTPLLSTASFDARA